MIQFYAQANDLQVFLWDISEINSSDYIDYDKYIFSNEEIGRNLKEIRFSQKRQKKKLPDEIALDLERTEKRAFREYFLFEEKNLFILLFSNKLVILNQEKVLEYKEGSIIHMNINFENAQDFLKGYLVNKKFLNLITIVI